MLETLKLLKFIGIDCFLFFFFSFFCFCFFFNQIALYHGVTQGDNCRIFETKDVTELENWKQIIFLGHPQLPSDKNSEDLAILVFRIWWRHCENHLLFFFFFLLSSGVQKEVQWRSTFGTVPFQDLSKSPFNSADEPSLNYRKHNWTSAFPSAAFLSFR